MANLCFFFFFQAEDGIRDKLVTGVQTCALPIWRRSYPIRPPAGGAACRPARRFIRTKHRRPRRSSTAAAPRRSGVGRGAWRGRGGISGGGGLLKKKRNKIEVSTSGRTR